MLNLAFIFLAVAAPQSNVPAPQPIQITPAQPTAPSRGLREAFQRMRGSERSMMQSNAQSVYTAPGVATLQGSQWVGTEHLYNLSKDLGVTVEIIKPASSSLPFNEGILLSKVFELLRQAGINPRPAGVMTKNTPLPFLHILVMVNPIENGFVAYCAARIFEEVQNKRVYLKPEIVWQAMTWEKQELIVSPNETFQQEVESTLNLLIKQLIERIKLQPKAQAQ